MTQRPPIPYSSEPPRRSNGLGVAGFIVSLVGIFTAGVLCPLGLLLSFFALFRAPRGFAIAGVIVGLLGTAFLALWLAFFGFVTISCLNIGRPMVITARVMQNADRQVETYAAAHGGMAPNAADGATLMNTDVDGWGRTLRYTPTGPRSYEIRSAGADGTFDTTDDQVESSTIGGP